MDKHINLQKDSKYAQNIPQNVLTKSQNCLQKTYEFSTEYLKINENVKLYAII